MAKSDYVKNRLKEYRLQPKLLDREVKKRRIRRPSEVVEKEELRKLMDKGARHRTELQEIRFQKLHRMEGELLRKVPCTGR